MKMLTGRQTLQKNLFAARVRLLPPLLFFSLAGTILQPAWWFLPLIGSSPAYLLVFSGIRWQVARKKRELRNRVGFERAEGLPIKTKPGRSPSSAGRIDGKME